MAFLAEVPRVIAFALSAMAATLRSREALADTAEQALSLTRRCLVPVALVVGPVGAMLAMQSLSLTRMFGVERLLAPLLAATVVRELAPGFSAVMICFQAGAGIAAELGTMRVQEEIDALDVMGLDPRAMVAGPRILGAAITGPILNAVAMLIGIFSAYFAAVHLFDMPQGMFEQTMWDGITITDLWISELKAIVFGLLIGSVSATFGFFTTGGPAGVGRAANRTVVATVILVLFTNYLLNTAVYGATGGGVL